MMYHFLAENARGVPGLFVEGKEKRAFRSMFDMLAGLDWSDDDVFIVRQIFKLFTSKLEHRIEKVHSEFVDPIQPGSDITAFYKMQLERTKRITAQCGI